MPVFHYLAKDKSAKTLKGKEEAGSKQEIIARLRSRGLFLISLKQDKASQKVAVKKIIRQTKGRRRSLKLQDFIFLARNLATLLSSGITLLRALKLVSYQTASLKLAEVLEKSADDIRNGLSFEEAVRKYPGIFSELWAGIIQVGEASGNLPFVLNKLADYLDMRAEFERKIKSALIYPAILMVVAVIALIVFVTLIFPHFQDIFRQFDVQLPLLTRVILAFAGFLKDYLLAIIFICAAAIFGFNYFKKRPEVKQFLDRTILRVYILGDAVFLACIERFTSILHILLESGLPLVYSLDVASKNIGNLVLWQKLRAVTKKVKEGSSLADELNRAEVFPLLVSEMAKIGEETGNMPDVFAKVSTHYRKELVTKIERVIAAFEPLMIIVVGIGIGVIVIALFLPLFSIATFG